MTERQLKAIIIDDEEAARIMLCALLEEYCPEITIVQQCSNVPEAVLAINKHEPDIIFLDIEMPEYNGFELINFFKKVEFEIIFVTAYSQYAIRAFEVSAIDYILKPVEVESLQKAVEKAKQKRQYANSHQRLDLMKSAYSGEEITKIALPLNDGLLFVDLVEIMMFEAERVYTNVFLKDGSKILVSKPMRVFEELLANRPLFFRMHRSHFINLNFIRKYQRKDSMIEMKNGITLSIARNRKQEFEDLLKELNLLV